MTLRDVIAQRAAQLNLSGWDLARQIRRQHGAWVISTDHMEKYLAGEKDMTSEKLDHVMKALGLLIAAPADFEFKYLPNDDERGNA